jgi:hypothetical protein
VRYARAVQRSIALAVCLAVVLQPASGGAHAQKTKTKTKASQTAATTPAANPAGDVWGDPLLVLTVEGGPYLYAGQIVVLFGLYSGGRVLYSTDERGIQHYWAATLTDAEQHTLLADLELELVGQLHPPSARFDDSSTACIRVWHGDIQAQDCFDAAIFSSMGHSHEMPPALTKIWRRLATFTSPTAKLWQPAQILVEARALDEDAGHCMAETTLPWPQSWPHRGAAGTSQEQPGRWSFALPGTALPELLRLQTGHTASGCRSLVIDGRRYWFSYFFDLPHQAAWTEAPR